MIYDVEIEILPGVWMVIEHSLDWIAAMREVEQILSEMFHFPEEYGPRTDVRIAPLETEIVEVVPLP